MKDGPVTVRPHARLDIKSAFNRKVLHLGNSAWGAFLRLVAEANDKQTDGLVDEHLLRIICDEHDREKLLSAFPWGASAMITKEGALYRLHDFLEWNDSAEIVRKRRQARVKAGRASGRTRREQVLSKCSNKTGTHGQRAGVGVGDGDGSDPDLTERVQGEPTAEPEQPPSTARLRAPTPRDVEYREAYERGIELGTGGRYVFPSAPWEQGALNDTLRKHAKDGAKALRGDDLIAWIEREAQAFADVGVDDARRWRGLSPTGFQQWQNEQRPGAPEVYPVTPLPPVRPPDPPIEPAERERRRANSQQALDLAANLLGGRS